MSGIVKCKLACGVQDLNCAGPGMPSEMVPGARYSTHCFARVPNPPTKADTQGPKTETSRCCSSPICNPPIRNSRIPLLRASTLGTSKGRRKH
eukprot:4225863-Alexandrium_andersonii.AAC.2